MKIVKFNEVSSNFWELDRKTGNIKLLGGFKQIGKKLRQKQLLKVLQYPRHWVNV